MRISDWSSDVCSSDLKHYGVEYRFVERSPLNTYLLEQSGMFQRSGTCEDVISGLLRDIATGCGPTRRADRLLSTILGSPYGFREAEAARGGFEAIEESDTDRPLFFLPLDNMLWTGDRKSTRLNFNH